MRLSNKALCLHRKSFARRTVTELSNGFVEKLKNGLEVRYNISNKMLGVLSDDPNPNEKYLHALKSAIPQVFRDAFVDLLPELNISERIIMNNFPMPSNFYRNSNSSNPSLINTFSVADTTKRVFLRNRTEEKLSDISNKVGSELDFIWSDSLSIIENLPLYISLSFLITTFALKFVQSLKWFRDPSSPKKIINKTDSKDDESNANLLKNVKQKPKQKEKNSNIEYIKAIFKDEKILFGKETLPETANEEIRQTSRAFSGVPEESNKKTERLNSLRLPKTSYMLAKFEEYVYKPVPNMKYSKQFLNTYTVAFMIIYLFTIYGLKVSNVFSQMIIKILYMAFKFILSDYRPFFKIDNLEFRSEFMVSCLLTSFIVFVQMLLSIRKFRLNLIKGNSIIKIMIFSYPSIIKNLVKTDKEAKNDPHKIFVQLGEYL